MGDPRYDVLYDYGGFVRSAPIEAPKGWKSLDAYLADLAQALHGLHTLSAHPFDQSVRGGAQVSLLGSADPAVAALPQALEAPIRAYVDALGKGEGPLRKRNTGAWTFKGMWSVKLASAGFHTNHIHNDGWLSSACYIELPDLPAEDAEKAGWLKLGEPGFTTKPPLGPEQFVRPEPGSLILFPSYMWHGTVPFQSKTPRLSVAFDLVPA